MEGIGEETLEEGREESEADQPKGETRVMTLVG